MTSSVRVRMTVAVAILAVLPVTQLGGQPAAATGTGTFTPTPCTASRYQPNPVFADGQPIVNDCPVTIRSASDVAARRQALVDFIWGAPGYPSTKLPGSVDRNVPSPVAGLTNLARVDTLHVAMELGQETVAHHFIPLAGGHNRLVVLQQGHDCTLNDDPRPDVGYGMQRTINALLADGYSVLAFYMPHLNDQLPSDCRPIEHDDMFRVFNPTGNVLKYFLEPIAVGLNYLQTRAATDGFPTYSNYSMIGLSGGGWTTVVYAAIDPRIGLSVPVAGSLPLYLRFPADEGDTEQNLAPFYRLAGYEDLHVMGSYGGGRRQVQVLNRYDDCCFGEAFHRSDLTGMTFDQATRSYEWRVRDTLARLGRGSFRLEIDEAAPAHMISGTTVANVLLAELDGDRRSVAATGAGDVFVHGTNGNLWHHRLADWQDTGLTMIGVPAAVASPRTATHVFFRDVDNHLVHATRTPSDTWTATPMGGTVITDPVATSAGDGTVDVVAVGPDYRPVHWSVHGTSVDRTPLGDTQVLGQPAVVAATGRVDVFFRGFDGQLHHVRATAGSVVNEAIGPGGIGSPAAIGTAGPDGETLRVYRRRNSRIWEASSTADGPWHWTRLEPVGTVDHFIGSPSVSRVGDRVVVVARTTRRTLGRFVLRPATGWRYANVGGWITDTPTSVRRTVYGRGRDGDLQRFARRRWRSVGGAFS
jgi:hypothetical protein